MSYDHSFEERARGFVLCFAANGVVNHLKGTGSWIEGMEQRDLHIDTIRDLLSSARKGLEGVCGSYEGGDFYRDIKSINYLYDACPKFKELRPEEIFSKLKAYLAGLRHLKFSGTVDEKIRDGLISLCDAISRYTFARVHTREAYTSSRSRPVPLT
ncbi:hypothetical protein KY343_00850 [Candidatus Woesearchaeota archaeon]|nr:hypothetical protein [Candidatus Woesearchaeota archaeon]